MNTESCSIIVLTSFAERRNSPFKRAAVDLELHRLAEVALGHRADRRATSTVGRTRSSISVLIESDFTAQSPMAPGTDMRCFEPPFLADCHAQPPHFARRCSLRERSSD